MTDTDGEALLARTCSEEGDELEVGGAELLLADDVLVLVEEDADEDEGVAAEGADEEGPVERAEAEDEAFLANWSPNRWMASATPGIELHSSPRRWSTSATDEEDVRLGAEPAPVEDDETCEVEDDGLKDDADSDVVILLCEVEELALEVSEAGPEEGVAPREAARARPVEDEMLLLLLLPEEDEDGKRPEEAEVTPRMG